MGSPSSKEAYWGSRWEWNTMLDGLRGRVTAQLCMDTLIQRVGCFLLREAQGNIAAIAGQRDSSSPGPGKQQKAGAPRFVCLKTEKEMQPLKPVQKVSPLPKQLDSRIKKEKGKERNVSQPQMIRPSARGWGRPPGSHTWPQPGPSTRAFLLRIRVAGKSKR